MRGAESYPAKHPLDRGAVGPRGGGDHPHCQAEPSCCLRLRLRLQTRDDLSLAMRLP